MRRLTPFIAIAVALVAIVAAGCGGGDGGGGSSAQESEYADAIAASFLSSSAGEDSQATDEDAACVGDRFVSIIGVDQLEAADATPESIEAADSLEAVVPDVTEEQAGQLVDATFECVDVGAIFAAQIASNTGVTLADDKIECLAENFRTNEDLRALFAQSILTGTDPDFDASPDALIAIVGDCLTTEDLLEIGQANQ